uniref:Insulinase family protein n=1 Tax=Prevotella sp. GTC17262 TaxID=3236797 RepID=A0AB33JDT9_9BACT
MKMFKTKKIIAFAVVLACSIMGIQAKDYRYVTVKGDPMQTRIYTLDNGLKIYLSVNKDAPRIQTYIAVRTGSRNDPAETTGLAHYLEHLMFKGTTHFGTSNLAAEQPLLDSIQNRYEVYRTIKDPAKRKAWYHSIDSLSQLAAKYNIPNEYDKMMASIGAEGTNAYTSNDVTCYQENIPANEIENWAKVQGDRFQNMVIRGFHTELEAVYEEYNIGLAKDNQKVWAALNAKIFPTHPYGTQTTIGVGDHLKNPSIVNIKNYFNKYYVPNNVAICMAGDLNPDQTVAMIDKYFGTWKKSGNLSRPEFPVQPDLTAAIDTTVVGLEAENLMMGWKFGKASSLQNDTLEVISSLLANGRAGLFDLNLNQAMKVQGVATGVNALADYSTFLVVGSPREGQTLEEVRALILGEIQKLKNGEFSDELLPSIVNNMKRDYYASLLNNNSRASQYVDAFINGTEWEQVVGRMDRISKMTKTQIVDFARRYFGQNFVCVYKKTGEDKSIKKIEKPAITPIPTNRDKSSDFLREVAASKPESIQPHFVDFKRDLTFAKTGKKLPVVYRQEANDKLFSLMYRYEFGSQSDIRYDYAASYADLLGTDKLSADQVKQKFYKLACDFGISVAGNAITVSLSGLNENMADAVVLAEDVLKNMKVDTEAYKKYVDLILKSRANNKKSQQSNFSALTRYGIYGEYNPQLNMLSAAQLKQTNPQTLVDLIKNLSNYQHTLYYCGPSSLATITKLVDKQHRMGKKLLSVPAMKEYKEQTTTQNEVLLAPYEAKNIYMMMYHNENQQWTPERAAVQAVFNEYFGSSMNSVVFQELREARGLAYSASARYMSPGLKGRPEWAQTYIISQNDKMADCIRVFNEILDTIPQSEAAFQLAKQSLTKFYASIRTMRGGLFNAYLKAKNLGLDYDLNKKVYETLPSIQLKDIVDFEQQHMARKPYRYIILGDEKNLNMKELEKIGPVKRVSTETIFGY